jgi:hypothetical protein
MEQPTRQAAQPRVRTIVVALLAGLVGMGLWMNDRRQ